MLLCNKHGSSSASQQTLNFLSGEENMFQQWPLQSSSWWQVLQIPASAPCYQPQLASHLTLGPGCITCSGSSVSAGSCFQSLTSLLLLLCSFPASHMFIPASVPHFSTAGEAGGGGGLIQVGSPFGNTEGYRGEYDAGEVSRQTLGAALSLHSAVIKNSFVLTSCRHLPCILGA